jgi:HAMP domain-containing protein
MTDDLVKRLRERTDLRMMTASLPPQPVKDWLCQEAADRIEALEAALERVIENIGFWVNDGLSEARTALGGKKDDLRKC